MPPFSPPALIKMFSVNVSVKLRAENSKLLAAGNRAIAVSFLRSLFMKQETEVCERKELEFC